MPELLWMEHPREGVCCICGDAQTAGGFVNFISDTFVHLPARPDQGRYGDVVGVVDICICANCIAKAGSLVGCMAPDQTLAMGFKLGELEAERDKLKDEVAAERQRFDNLLSGAASYRDGYSDAAKNKTKGT